jgi:diguanylate cyclase (GGDEF)-like protein/PAS domain S-box-containing protein
MAWKRAFNEAVLDSLHDGVYVVDRDFRIGLWSAGAEQLTGYSRDEVVGQRCSADVLAYVNADGTFLDGESGPLARALSEGRPHEVDLFLHRKDGTRLPVRVRAVPMTGRFGRVRGAVEIIRDLSSHQAALARIQDLERTSFLDGVTGLANQIFTTITLETRLDEMARYRWPFGVLCIDVDRLEDINARHGRDGGDKLLKTFGRTIAHNMRSFDLIGRWQDDELLAIVVNMDERKLATMAERLRMLVQASHVAHAGGDVNATVSIGVAFARADDTVEALVARAEQLMNASRNAGGNRITVQAVR